MSKNTRDLLATKLGRLDVMIFEAETGRHPDASLAALYAERGRVWRQIAATYPEDTSGRIGSLYAAADSELRARLAAGEE